MYSPRNIPSSESLTLSPNSSFHSKLDSGASLSTPSPKLVSRGNESQNSFSPYAVPFGSPLHHMKVSNQNTSGNDHENAPSSPSVHSGVSSPTVPHPWKECKNETTGTIYYWNIKTDETTAEPPKVVRSMRKESSSPSIFRSPLFRRANSKSKLDAPPKVSPSEVALQEVSIGAGPKKGFLFKQKGNGSKWKKYWFVLLDDKLVRFKDEMETMKKGEISLVRAIVEEDLLCRRAFTIQILTAKRKRVRLSCDSQFTMTDWLQSIKDVAYGKGINPDGSSSNVSIGSDLTPNRSPSRSPRLPRDSPLTPRPNPSSPEVLSLRPHPSPRLGQHNHLASSTEPSAASPNANQTRALRVELVQSNANKNDSVGATSPVVSPPARPQRDASNGSINVNKMEGNFSKIPPALIRPLPLKQNSADNLLKPERKLSNPNINITSVTSPPVPHRNLPTSSRSKENMETPNGEQSGVQMVKMALTASPRRFRSDSSEEIVFTPITLISSSSQPSTPPQPPITPPRIRALRQEANSMENSLANSGSASSSPSPPSSPREDPREFNLRIMNSSGSIDILTASAPNTPRRKGRGPRSNTESQLESPVQSPVQILRSSANASLARANSAPVFPQHLMPAHLKSQKFKPDNTLKTLGSDMAIGLPTDVAHTAKFTADSFKWAMDGNIEKSGVLERQDGTGNWKLQWIIIDKGIMRFYNSKHSKAEVGQIVLKGSVVEASKSTLSSPGARFARHCFQVTCSFQRETFLFSAESDEELEEWLNAVKINGAADADWTRRDLEWRKKKETEEEKRKKQKELEEEEEYIKNKKNIEEERRLAKERRSSVDPEICPAEVEVVGVKTEKGENVLKVKVDFAGQEWYIHRSEKNFSAFYSKIIDRFSSANLSSYKIKGQLPKMKKGTDSKQLFGEYEEFLRRVISERHKIFRDRKCLASFVRFIAPVKYGDEKTPDFVMPFKIELF